MATPMLNCSICPKRPNFSDTSHLLTHVGSKGHLAHLHKLQVRSHQEIAAGHQLATYNQWYQHYGLGQLLSERLQQKDSKTTHKRNRASQAVDSLKNEEVVAYGDAANFALVSPDRVRTNIAPRRRRTRPSRLVKLQPNPESDSDYESSPIKRNRRRRARMLYSSPAKGPTSGNLNDSSDADCPAEEDFRPPTTPENAKPKGVVWPGMHLFDAATVQMKRKRNQKKDSSVLKKMQTTSAMIEPTEVIYTSEGIMIKERYIDGNVNDSSPLLGETPIPKPSVRKRRQPLATLSANVPRFPKRSVRDKKPSTSNIFREPPPTFRSRLQNIPSSSTDASLESNSRFSPTEDESVEFKLTVEPLANRKRHGNFTIFNENSDRYPQPTIPTMKTEGSLLQPGVTQGPLHAIPPRPQLSFLTAPWLQPQYQLPGFYNNNQLDYRPPAPALKSYPDTYAEKENIEWTTGDMDFTTEGLTANPLSFQWSGSSTQQPFGLNVSPVHNHQPFFGEAIAQHDDPFIYGRNPLSGAFGQFERPFMSSSEGNKQRAVSPDGTISDHEGTGR